MTNLIPFLLFAFSASITPGPNNFMLLNSGLHFGIKKSLPHYFGICIGFPLMGLIVALGFGALFTEFVWIKHVLKVIGIAYMLYLAFKVLTASTELKSIKEAKPINFLQATLFQWVNPKAWLMLIGAISIFSINQNYFNNAIAISVLYFLVLLPTLSIWLVFGAILKKILKEEKHRRWFNIIMAICLVASVALMVRD